MPKKKNPKEVGKSYPEPKVFTYLRCKPEKDGWVDPNKYLPLAYDLVDTKIDRDGKTLNKSYIRWWTGSNWDGRRPKFGEKIIGWKRRMEEENEY